MHFDYKKFHRKGLRIIALYYLDVKNRDKKEIWVLPNHGMNLCKYTANNLKIIEFNPDEIRQSFYGTPLLYITPNKMLKEKYPLESGDLKAVNGLLYNEPFNGLKINKTDRSISVSAYVDFEEKSHLFEAFPFKHRLTITYTLDKSGVRFDYEIENKEIDQSVPYSIGLSPNFAKIDGEKETAIKAPYKYAYNTSEELIPTVELNDIDLSEFVAIGNLDLDTVFTGSTNNDSASIKYSRSGLKVTLKSSDDFSYMGVHTPKGKSYFCMENQTCATNLCDINSSEVKENSGFRYVEPESKFGGYVQFLTEKL